MTAKDRKFMQTASAVASIWSKDPSTKVGCVAVGARPNLVAWGYNGFPPGLDDSEQRLAHRDTKLQLTRHAEANAMSNATFEVKTLYVTRHPCANCALEILAARTVERVVYLPDPEFEARWQDSLTASASLLEEGGVRLEALAP